MDYGAGKECVLVIVFEVIECQHNTSPNSKTMFKLNGRKHTSHNSPFWTVT